MRHPSIEIGDKFNRWTVVGFDPHPLYLLCRCECGVERKVNRKNLKAGTSRSCGCWDQERKTTHGKSRTKEYALWHSMFNRTENNIKYIQKGIKVCDRWSGAGGFENFLEDMGPCPEDKYSVDRHPDKNGNYEPGNCRWASREEQQQHKSNTKMFTFNGKTQSIFQWAKEYNLPRSLVASRIDRGKTIEQALTAPQGARRGRGTPQTKDRLIEYKGRTQTLAQWAVEFDLTITTMVERVFNQWPMERIEKTPQGGRGGHTKAKARNEAMKKDPSLTLAGDILLKYMSEIELDSAILTVLEDSSPLDKAVILNLLCGGARPKFKLPGNIANQFAFRPNTPDAD